MSRPRASAAATAQLAGRSLDGLAYGAAWEALMVSTLGFGAHGEPAAIAAALNRYLARGGNFLDAQDQPAALGAALAAVRAADPARRAEWVICAESSADPAETAALVAAGLAAPESGVSGYCFAPAAVRQQVRRALGQLGLETVDLFWLAEWPEAAALVLPASAWLPAHFPA